MSGSEDITNGVSNIELQRMCQGEWLNDNVITENDCISSGRAHLRLLLLYNIIVMQIVYTNWILTYYIII